MSANLKEVRILSILDEIIAYFITNHKKKSHAFPRISHKKKSIFLQPVAKNLQIFKIFGQIITYLQTPNCKKLHVWKSQLLKKVCFDD